MKQRTVPERILLVILAACALWCGSAPGSWAGQSQGQQSLDYVLRLMGRHASAHACPIEPRLALTSGHVIDLRPFDRDIGLFPYGWSDGFGNSGWVVPQSVEMARDLGRMTPFREGDTFPHVLPVAEVAPALGSRIWLLGYRWDGRKNALGEDVIEAKVTRIVANHLIFIPAGKPGSSGSCVLNDAGQVVGINEGAFTTDDKDEAGLAVAVWGVLKDPPK